MPTGPPARRSSAGLRRDGRSLAGVYDEHKLVSDPVVDEAYAWVRSRPPDPVAPSLVHGDYRIGNCLVDDGRISAILDWELSHVGDPRFDLGYMSLDYHAGKFTSPGSPLLNAVADRDWFHRRYTELSGRPVDLEVVEHVRGGGGADVVRDHDHGPVALLQR